MKSSTKDKIKGRVEQAKGAVKEKAGRATGNRDLQDRGTTDKVKGTVRNKIGDVKKVGVHLGGMHRQDRHIDP